VGISDKRTNCIDGYAGFGIVYSGNLSKHHYYDQLGLAVAAAHVGEKLRSFRLLQGESLDNWEIAIELFFRTRINSAFSMQPDLQYIFNPGFDSSLKNTFVAGIRTEIFF